MPDLILDWFNLAVSLFITFCLLWLGLMVLLAGRRRSAGAWLAGAGLLLGALFFTSHSAILGLGLGSITFGMDFWWWVSWIPAVAAPFAWYAALLWYAGFRFDRPHPHRIPAAGVFALGWVILVMLVFANPLPVYSQAVGGRLVDTPSMAGMPLLVLGYILYSLLCYLLPLDALRLAVADGDALAASARRRARPWLTGATLSLLLAGAVMTATALWIVYSVPTPSLSEAGGARTVKEFDLAVQVCIAAAVVLLGRAVVGYEVFTGQPLVRGGFFRQWRSTVLLAAGFAALAAGVNTIHLRPLYGYILAMFFVVIFYALYAWRSFHERQTFMEKLAPFLASQDLYSQLAAPGVPSSSTPQALFENVCREALGARAAVLVPLGALATLAGRPLEYAAGRERVGIPGGTRLAERFAPGSVRCLPAAEFGAEWGIALRDGAKLNGVLLLAPKTDGSPYTEEEMDIARAGGERVLDMLSGAEMARLAMDLLRQRMAQVQVMEGQGRRAMHDDILPLLHTAILHLGDRKDDAQVHQTVEALTQAHRRIAELVRQAPPPAPHHLQEAGLAGALQAMLEVDFAGDFTAAHCDVEQEAAEAARRLPSLTSEVVFFAARELVRNAARYGRGGDLERPLHLWLRLEQAGGFLSLVVEDDGVGFDPSAPPQGGGSGLRFHAAMLAVVGARLEVGSRPGGGTRAVVEVENQNEPSNGLSLFCAGSKDIPGDAGSGETLPADPEQTAYDCRRDERLTAPGWRVMRIPNARLRDSLKCVLAEVARANAGD